ARYREGPGGVDRVEVWRRPRRRRLDKPRNQPARRREPSRNKAKPGGRSVPARPAAGGRPRRETVAGPRDWSRGPGRLVTWQREMRSAELEVPSAFRVPRSALELLLRRIGRRLGGLAARGCTLGGPFGRLLLLGLLDDDF